MTPNPAALAAQRAARDAGAPSSARAPAPPVVLTGIDVPFYDLVWLLFKWSVAAIPVAGFWFAFYFLVSAVAHALIVRFGL